MRQQISYEGHDESIPGQIWYPGCHILDPDARYHVVESGDDQYVIGFARDVRRESDGRITADIRYELEPPPHQAPTIVLQNVEKHDFKGTLFVTSGTIGWIFMTEACSWAPGWDDFIKHKTENDLERIQRGEEVP